MEPKAWKWWHYYWGICQHVGQESYRTWRGELLASVVVVFFIFVFTGEWKDFRTAMVATACTLGAFSLWHLLRSPWILHQSGQGSQASPGFVAGLFGIVVMVGIIVGFYELALTMWRVRPVGSIEATIKALPLPIVEKGRVERVTLQGPCKLTAEQINPAKAPQACPSAPPPTFEDRVLTINAHLTEGDRNRFSNALSEFEESLNQGQKIFNKINEKGRPGNQAIAKDPQPLQKTLTDLAAEGWKYKEAFPAVRAKWDMFREQTEYIFGDNPDNEGPNALINATEGYRNYLQWWSLIPNKEQPPFLNLLGVEQVEFQNRLTVFSTWHGGCVNRIAEMRSSIR